MGQGTILVVDDDSKIRDVLRFALEQAQFAVVEAEDGAKAITQFGSHQIDLVILDVLMPEMPGTEVCRALRQQSQVPILFLTSVQSEVDRIIGLELGGDDYVPKPFSPREIVARVKAILRRTQSSPAETKPPTATLQHGDLEWDQTQYAVRFGGEPVILTTTEFEILGVFMKTPQKVYNRAELMERSHGVNIIVTERTIDTHIKRIRKKFAPLGVDPIRTVHGVGYQLGQTGGQPTSS